MHAEASCKGPRVNGIPLLSSLSQRSCFLARRSNKAWEVCAKDCGTHLKLSNLTGLLRVAVLFCWTGATAEFSPRLSFWSKASQSALQRRCELRVASIQAEVEEERGTVCVAVGGCSHALEPTEALLQVSGWLAG